MHEIKFLFSKTMMQTKGPHSTWETFPSKIKQSLENLPPTNSDKLPKLWSTARNLIVVSLIVIKEM